MKWIIDKPTKYGLYWYRDALHPATVVEFSDGGFGSPRFHFIGYEVPYSPEMMNGQFAGPLEPPTE